MTTIISVTPGPTRYHTREQLYALCVLLCWSEGLSLGNNVQDSEFVTLNGVEGGNTGVSVFLLKNNPNVKEPTFTEPEHVPYATIFFKVLGVQLEVNFNEQGVGTVQFPDQPFAERI